MTQNFPEFIKNGKSSELVVVLHQFRGKNEMLQSIRDQIIQSRPDADIYTPQLPLTYFSPVKPQQVVDMLSYKIDYYFNQNHEKVVFIGHSLGAVLVRWLYLNACTYKAGPKPWAEKVERIILFGAVNRGWRLSFDVNFWFTFVSTIGLMIWTPIQWLLLHSPFRYLVKLFNKIPGVHLPTEPLLIMQFKRGSPIITQIRVRWIRMRNKRKTDKIGGAKVIQILGSVDDVVSPLDSIDLVSGRDYYYLEMPYSGHGNMIYLDSDEPVPGKPLQKIGQERSRIFQLALNGDEDGLQEENISSFHDKRWQSVDNFNSNTDIDRINADKDVTDVVFVIHGIRDYGFWTNKVANHVLKHARLFNSKQNDKTKKRVYATETSSYGRFPILPFLSLFQRREKVEWLMDLYAENLARYPNAEFSFFGHSNGTYLLAKALQEYPECSFRNIAFAGSVVDTNFDWMHFIKRGQVKNVLNYVATADWVVAWFPNVFQKLGIQDLGGAGHHGFRYLPDNHEDDGKADCLEVGNNNILCQLSYVSGGHNAAIQEPVWSSIAQFIVEDRPGSLPLMQASEVKKGWLKWVGLVVWSAILFIIISPLLMFWSCPEFKLFINHQHEISQVLWTVVWLFLIRHILAVF
ncbi:MAG: alpha/beta hydrolase [Magnetococcales bacterium]|nr:alpha/beta hydrolase [Magnetococcales bacterium]